MWILKCIIIKSSNDRNDFTIQMTRLFLVRCRSRCCCCCSLLRLWRALALLHWRLSTVQNCLSCHLPSTYWRHFGSLRVAIPCQRAIEGFYYHVVSREERSIEKVSMWYNAPCMNKNTILTMTPDPSLTTIVQHPGLQTSKSLYDFGRHGNRSSISRW